MIAKLTMRNLAAHRLRFVFTTLAVTLAVAFITGTMIFRDTAERGFDKLFSDMARNADLTVTIRPKQTFTSDDAPPRLVPRSLLSTLTQQVPDAQSFLGVTEGYAAIVKPDGEAVGGGSAAHLGRAYNTRSDSTSSMNVVSGHTPSGADDVAVEERTATEGGIKVGDTVDIVAQHGSRTMRVVGIFSLGQENLQGVLTLVSFAPDVAQQLLTGSDQYSAIWARPRTGTTQQQLITEINRALPADYEVLTGADLAAEAKSRIQNVFDVLGRFLLAFAAISVLVGSFIIFNTFTMLLAQRTRELALLRAVGASRGQVTRAVIGEAIGIGVIGSTLGLLAGVGVAYTLRLLFQQFGVALRMGVPVIRPATAIWAYGIGVLVTMLAAYLPARRAAKIPPVAALRDDVALPSRSLTLRLILGTVLAAFAALSLAGGLSKPGESATTLVGFGGILLFIAVTLLSPVLSRPFIRVLASPVVLIAGTTGRLSRENARRNPRRSAATASALMVGLALVSLATVVAASLSASTDRKLDKEFGADYSMEPKGLSGFSQEAVDKVAAVPGVRSVAPVRYGTVRIGTKESSVIVADPQALVTPARLAVESGSAALGPGDLLVQHTAAAQLGWRVGTTLAGQYPDRTTVTLRVAGIFADSETVNRPYILSPTSYLPHTSEALIQKAYVDLDDAGQAAIRDRVRAALSAYPNIQLKDRQDAKDDARKNVNQALNVIMGLLALSIVIAALGIVNTLGLSVIERTREIGLLRAVGMSRGQVRSMIRYESVIIALFGAALGLALGIALGWALQKAMSTQVPNVLSIPVARLGLYLVAAIAIGVLAALWPAWRAARMNVLHAIHEQ